LRGSQSGREGEGQKRRGVEQIVVVVMLSTIHRRRREKKARDLKWDTPKGTHLSASLCSVTVMCLTIVANSSAISTGAVCARNNGWSTVRECVSFVVPCQWGHEIGSES
jgi:hypothetical protein